MLDILLNVVSISNGIITECLQNLLEIVFVMLKDTDHEILKGAEKLDSQLKSIIKNVKNEKVAELDLPACLHFICMNLEFGKGEIKSWIVSWLNILLTIDKIDLTANIPIFLREIINLIGKEGNEVSRSIEKFLNDARIKFS